MKHLLKFSDYTLIKENVNNFDDISKEIINYVKSNSYFDLDYIHADEYEIGFATRKNGNRPNETHSPEDYKEGVRLYKELQSRFNSKKDLKIVIEPVDEFVLIRIEFSDLIQKDIDDKNYYKKLLKTVDDETLTKLVRIYQCDVLDNLNYMRNLKNEQYINSWECLDNFKELKLEDYPEKANNIILAYRIKLLRRDDLYYKKSDTYNDFINNNITVIDYINNDALLFDETEIYIDGEYDEDNRYVVFATSKNDEEYVYSYYHPTKESADDAVLHMEPAGVLDLALSTCTFDADDVLLDLTFNEFFNGFDRV